MRIAEAIMAVHGIATYVPGDFETVAETYPNIVWYTDQKDDLGSAIKSKTPLLSLVEVEVAVAGYVHPRLWPWRQFTDRFNDVEWAAIKAAAAGNVTLDRWIDEARAVNAIWSNGARTIAGMAALVAAGLITAARRDEILDPAREPSVS